MAHDDAARAARETFARNMRRLRRERGMTQEALSLESGLMQSYVSEVEAAKRNVSVDNIGRIARALGMPITELFGD